MRRTIHPLFIVASATAVAVACRDASAPESPPCAQPAPLLGTYDPAAPSVIVQYRSGVDAAAETARLAAKYRFTPTYVYTSAIQGFSAQVSSSTVANLRCEATVAAVEHDSVARLS